MKIYIGIDPGKSGGIGFINEDGEVWAVKNDCTYHDLTDAVRDAHFAGHATISHAVIERFTHPRKWESERVRIRQSFGSL